MPIELLTLLIWFLPLAAAGGIALFTQRNKPLSAALSVGAVLTGFVLSVALVVSHGWVKFESALTWLELGPLQVEFGVKLDPLSLLMMLVVTGVGGLIHVYSLGYMRGDPGWSRYFACLSLFTFSMLGIVLANNFVLMFIFWELVGVSSYLLIGFWFEKPSAADAAKKAFLTNRLGDFGFMLGILIIWGKLGSIHFATLQETLLANPAALGGLATVAGLLIFCGAVGKSAQFPLHVWLPDAMEGPTPVSALIHAATMVAAGVYMLCRVHFIFTPEALMVIAWVGGVTALLAALIAIQQNDIKRVLAYSTISQLAYMVMAVGLGGPVPAIFHLATHAFFKALLFLGAGSVIIALHHEQDIWKMGGLRAKMPVTYWTFMAGVLAIAGVPPLSGFYSKDSILAQAAHQHNWALFGLGAVVAALTTFYMFRLAFAVFFGSERSETARHAHESPGVMTWPLRILALFSVIGGLIGIDTVLARQFARAELGAMSFGQKLIEPFVHAPLAAGCSLVALLLGFAAAYALYARADKDLLPHKLGALATWMRRKFYFDELYEATVIRLHDFIAAVADWVDRWIIEGCCIGLVRGGTDLVGRALRLAQTGNLQTYGVLFVLGLAVVLWFVLGR
ncbi:MAG: NADH-quinone oxidoreductase subunit L [Verrucomicrobiae bacterium]|nr:NADH-quinone oxidoreductase subunit L [Verrucomicrobiae bacterium]